MSNRVSPDIWYEEESTCLDASTVPTYEEFIKKSSQKNKPKKNHQHSFLRTRTKKFSLLNSTEACTSLLTDDESSQDDSILDITATINNLELKDKIITNSINNNNKTPLVKQHDEHQKENQTPVRPNSLLRLPLETAPPKLLTSRIHATNASPKLNESHEYIFYYNKLTQTSFVFDETSKNSSREPSIIVLNDSIEDLEEESDTKKNEQTNDTVAKQLVLNISSSSSSEATPQINKDFLDKLNNVTLRKTNRKSLRRSVLITDEYNKKRVSICGDGMTREQLRINETILDESENESDAKKGLIYSLYESAEEDVESDHEAKQTPVKWSNQQRTIVSDTSSSSSNTPSKIQPVQKRVSKKSSEFESGSTSSDSKFENFLSNFRQPNQRAAQLEKENKIDMKKFIVDTEDEEEEDSSSFTSSEKNRLSKEITKSKSKSSTASESDEQLFYIKTTQKLDEINKKKKKNSAKISRSSLLNDSDQDSNQDDHELESDKSFDSKNSSMSGSLSSSSSSLASPISSTWNTFRQNQPKKLNTFKTPTHSKNNPNDLRLVKTQQVVKPRPTQNLSFIESLTTLLDDESRRDPSVLVYMKKYKNKNIRSELLRECYAKLNEGAFDNRLPKDLKLVWSSRLTSTGGYCKNYPNREKPTSEIHLSTKVCDTPERMRDVLAHEMCHAAAFLLNGVLDGHGSIWKSWAARVNFSFKHIPKITVYHSYQIKKKFIYKCQKCLSEIHRFSKSIDINKQICGICHGRFVLINANKQDEAKATFDDIVNNREPNLEALQTPAKQPNAFSLFVKDNYQSVKKEQNLTKHQDVMKELGNKFKLLSTNNK